MKAVKLNLSVEQHDVLGTIQDEIIALMRNGQHVSCPMCGRLCKIYPRKLNKEMARFIIRLVRRYEVTRDWVHVREIVKTNTFASSNGTMLIQWGMLLHKAKDPRDTKHKTSGLWKPTQRGIDFVYNRVRVPSHLKLYHDVKTGESTTTVNIIEALGESFHYTELMAQETLVAV